MPDSNHTPVRVSPLLPTTGAHIVESDKVTLSERKSMTCVQVLTFRGQYEATASAISKALGVECPTTANRCGSDGKTQITWNGPNSWMVICNDDETGRQAGELLQQLKKTVTESMGAVVDQSHGRSILRLSGPMARQVMQKATAVDTDASSFKEGHSAMTQVAHMNAQIIKVDEKPSFDLIVIRSLARSFAHSIEHFCLEFAHE